MDFRLAATMSILYWTTLAFTSASIAAQKCLEMAFVQLAEAVEITGDCVLCMSFLQLLKYNTALFHKLHIVLVSGSVCACVWNQTLSLCGTELLMRDVERIEDEFFRKKRGASSLDSAFVLVVARNKRGQWSAYDEG